MTAAVAVAGAIPESQPTWLGTNVFTQIRVLTLRALKTVVRDPRIIVFSVIQPLVMLALFSQIFSSIAQTPGFPAGVSYIAYLMPAILVNTAMGSAMQSGVGLVNDMRNGVLARFRSLPIAHGSVLAARSLSDLVRTAFQLLITLVFGILVFGFWPAGGIVGLLGALLLGLLLSWALGWIITRAVGIDLALQWSVFGSSGALTFQLLSGLTLAWMLRGNRVAPVPAAEQAS